MENAGKFSSNADDKRNRESTFFRLLFFGGLLGSLYTFLSVTLWIGAVEAHRTGIVGISSKAMFWIALFTLPFGLLLGGLGAIVLGMFVARPVTLFSITTRGAIVGAAMGILFGGIAMLLGTSAPSDPTNLFLVAIVVGTTGGIFNGALLLRCYQRLIDRSPR